METNTYLLEEKGHVLVIDPTDHCKLLTECSEAESVTVLLTHEHFDHISGLNKLRETRMQYQPYEFCRSGDTLFSEIGVGTRFSSLVIAGVRCSERIQDARANMSLYADVLAELAGKRVDERLVPFTCQAVDIAFKDRLMFRWLGHTVEMFAVPGHSAGSCCILVDNLLFVGDTILANNLMAQFPGSSKKLYREVTAPLLEPLLAGELRERSRSGKVLLGEWPLVDRVTSVYPGHGDVMTPETALGLIRGV